MARRKITHYSQEIKNEAAIQYAIKGVMSHVSRALDIPEPTLCEWKRSDWWLALTEEVRSEKSDEHIARYQSLTTKALEAADDGIDKLKGKTLTAADIKALVVTGATCTDKARLLLNQPTSIKGDSDSIKSLTDMFTKLSQDHKNIQGSVVSVQEKEVP